MNSPPKKSSVTKKTEKERKFIFKERKKYYMKLEDETQINVAFEYYNHTKEMLFIDTIKTHCGCTTVSYPRNVIRPHDNGEIKVNIRPPESDGFFSQTLVVYFKGNIPVILQVYGKREHSK